MTEVAAAVLNRVDVLESRVSELSEAHRAFAALLHGGPEPKSGIVYKVAHTEDAVERMAKAQKETNDRVAKIDQKVGRIGFAITTILAIGFGGNGILASRALEAAADGGIGRTQGHALVEALQAAGVAITPDQERQIFGEGMK